MKRLGITFLLGSLFFISCKKDQSTIGGTAWFQDSLGNQTKAANIDLDLRSDGIAGPIEMTTTTNSQGDYMFVNVTDGHHWMTAEETKDGHEYYYASDVIFTEKDDPVDIDPILNW